MPHATVYSTRLLVLSPAHVPTKDMFQEESDGPGASCFYRCTVLYRTVMFSYVYSTYVEERECFSMEGVLRVATARMPRDQLSSQ